MSSGVENIGLRSHGKHVSTFFCGKTLICAAGSCAQLADRVMGCLLDDEAFAQHEKLRGAKHWWNP